MAVSIITAIIFFGVIIFVHELGHFLTARLFGVKINEFSIGMGPKLVSSRSEKSGILYSLRILPVGGYVSMDGEDEHSNDKNAFCNKKAWQRFIILSAGAFMNVALGFIIIICTITLSDNVYSNKIDSFLVRDESGNIVTEYQGLFEGDEIIAINSEKIHVRYDYVFSAMRTKGNSCSLTVKRDDATVVIENFRFPTTEENGGTFGNPTFFIPQTITKTVFSVIREASYQTVSVVKMVLYSLHDLLRGGFSKEAVSGPVGVVSEISETAKLGLSALFTMISLITINIGVFNLLPFPALDGGRIVFLLFETITRKKISDKTEGFINFMGLVILFGFMIFITYNDILKLVS